MTALVVAGAGGGFVQPDQILPPGFDRIGEAVRFEQERAEAGVQPCFASETRRPSAVLTAPPPAPVASLDDQFATLRPETAARVRRYLGSRGSLTSFCVAAGISEQGLRVSLDRIIRHGGPLAEAIELRKESRGTLTASDLVACTRCHLHGHVAGDPDRCLFYRGSLGMGGQSSQTERAR